MNKFASTYYRPKPFEYYGNDTIYDLIGIRLYKKYLPSTGDIVRQWRKLKQIDLNRADRFEELYRYEKKTRNYEWRHIFGIALSSALIPFIERELIWLDWLIIFLLNLVINIYPIFLQRYNRIRILKVLQRNGLPSPYNNGVV